MSRKRSVSTKISIDGDLGELSQYGLLPLLIYTWAIPHTDDWGRITGDAREFRALVCPLLDVTTQQVEEALDQIASVKRWERYEVDGCKVIAFPIKAWYAYQSYISLAVRRVDNSKLPAKPAPGAPRNRQRRRTPENTSSYSSSVSSSLSDSVSVLSPTGDSEVVVESTGVQIPVSAFNPQVHEPTQDELIEQFNADGVDIRHIPKFLEAYAATGWIKASTGLPITDYRLVIKSYCNKLEAWESTAQSKTKARDAPVHIAKPADVTYGDRVLRNQQWNKKLGLS